MEKYDLKKENSTLIVVGDEINRHNYSDFEDIINNLLQNGCVNIVISFNGLKYILTDAIKLLVSTQMVLESRGGNLVVTDLNKYTSWALDTFEETVNFKITDKINKAMEIIE